MHTWWSYIMFIWGSFWYCIAFFKLREKNLREMLELFLSLHNHYFHRQTWIKWTFWKGIDSRCRKIAYQIIFYVIFFPLCYFEGGWPLSWWVWRIRLGRFIVIVGSVLWITSPNMGRTSGCWSIALDSQMKTKLTLPNIFTGPSDRSPERILP